MEKIKTHRELKVYQSAFKAAMTIFDLSKEFPKEEVYSLTDQIRRSSRSVCANTAEAFRRRKYPKSFSNKLNESEAEAAETQNWLDFALNCGYITEEDHTLLDNEYENIIGMLVSMPKTSRKMDNLNPSAHSLTIPQSQCSKPQGLTNQIIAK